MPRPVSWLPRLYEIRRSVENSVRTHYDSAAIAVLFKLQPRAAGNLMDMLPQVAGPGRSRLVEREALGKFLDDVLAAEDVTAVCIQQRAEKENVSRKLPRSLVLREFEPVDPASLSLWLSRGHLEVRFETIEQLVDVLWRIACVTTGGGLEEFIQLYAPAKPVVSERELESEDARALRVEIEQMEADWMRLQAAKKYA